jgi:Flp pilus assembly protein TadG
VPKVRKKPRRGLADFAQDRKGTVAIKLGLIVFGPMILLDAFIGLLS